LPGLLNRLVGLPFPAKLLVSAALLIPLGFAMGMPFPTGLRALAEDSVSELRTRGKIKLREIRVSQSWWSGRGP